MKRLVVLVGNIGGGKTTITNDLVKLGYNVISRDAMRYMLGNGQYVFELITEKIINKIALSMLRQMVQKNLDIIIDETNMSVAIREEILKIANKKNYETIAYVMPKISKRKSIERRLSNNHGNTTKEVWSEVWEKFNAMYEEPTHDEGFDKVITGINHEVKNV